MAAKMKPMSASASLLCRIVFSVRFGAEFIGKRIGASARQGIALLLRCGAARAQFFNGSGHRFLVIEKPQVNAMMRMPFFGKPGGAIGVDAQLQLRGSVREFDEGIGNIFQACRHQSRVTLLPLTTYLGCDRFFHEHHFAGAYFVRVTHRNHLSVRCGYVVGWFRALWRKHLGTVAALLAIGPIVRDLWILRLLRR